MKHSVLFVVVASLFFVVLSIVIYTKSERVQDDFFNRNVDALTEDESTPTIPCEQAASICYYTVKDIHGNYYSASTTGMKRK